MPIKFLTGHGLCARLILKNINYSPCYSLNCIPLSLIAYYHNSNEIDILRRKNGLDLDFMSEQTKAKIRRRHTLGPYVA